VDLEKVKRIIREAEKFSNDIVTGMMLAIPSDLVEMGYLSIVIDENAKDAEKAIAWTHRLIIEVPEEDYPDELIEKVIKQAMERSKYNLFASITPVLEEGLRILENNIHVKNSSNN
jgi:hypothetical protein